MIKKLTLTATLLLASIAMTGTASASPENFENAYTGESYINVCTSIGFVNGKVERSMNYIYSDKRSSYFIVNNIDPDNNILRVENRLMSKWKLDKNNIKMGKEFTGIYSEDGQNILRIKK